MVLKEVPPNSTVVGVPGRVVIQDGVRVKSPASGSCESARSGGGSIAIHACGEWMVNRPSEMSIAESERELQENPVDQGGTTDDDFTGLQHADQKARTLSTCNTMESHACMCAGRPSTTIFISETPGCLSFLTWSGGICSIRGYRRHLCAKLHRCR